MTKRIVVVGAGFLGLSVARSLRKTLSRKDKIVLIDPKDHFLFTPRLIDALAGRADESVCKTDLKSLAQREGFTFIQGKVTEIRRDDKSITFIKDGHRRLETLPYHILVLGQGAGVNDYGIEGVVKETYPLKTWDDILRIRRQIKTLDERHCPLSFAVVGGGASGIEALFALKRYADNICGDRASYHVVEGAPQILNGFPQEAINLGRQLLKKEGVTVLEGEGVKVVDSEGITTTTGRRIKTDLILWTAGIKPNVIPLSPEATHGPGGFFFVDHFLRLDGHTFAAGDVVTYKEQNITVPKNAQTALLMAETVAYNVRQTLKGRRLKPFHYRSIGNILVFGDTGMIDLKHMAIKTRFAPVVRDLFYRYRHWQITGR